MSWGSWLLWGFVATVALTTFMSSTTGLGLTRINLPFMLGTLFTPNRDRAKWFGFLVHIADGWIFSLIYVLAFQSVHLATWWFGALIGAVHAAFVLTVGMTLLPGLHPRMASERHGPDVVRVLEPPGFLALHYGVRTPIFVFLAHILFGAILGGFYRLS